MEKLNRQKTGVFVSLAILFIGILMFSIPFLVEMDMMNGGFALIFVGAFISVMGFISYLIFKKRFKVRQRMIAGDVLAHWVYDRASWKKVVDEEISDSAGLKIMGFVFFGIFALIGIISFLADDDNLLFAEIMTGIAVLFLAVGFISYGLRKKTLMSDPGEVTITRDGVYYMGYLTDWNGVTSVLDAVGFHPKKTNVLVFRYRELSGRAARMRRSTLHLPVPAGMEDQAALVVDFFKLPLTKRIIDDITQDEE